jgi:hypothetical protein
VLSAIEKGGIHLAQSMFENEGENYADGGDQIPPTLKRDASDDAALMP